MASVDERNQDDQSDGIEENDENSKKEVADDVGVADPEAENSEEEESDEESDENDQGVF